MSQIFIRVGDSTINTERVLRVEKSTDGGTVFFDNDSTLPLSEREYSHLSFLLSMQSRPAPHAPYSPLRREKPLCRRCRRHHDGPCRVRMGRSGF